MSISFVWLLAHIYCTLLLLPSFVSTATANPTGTTPNSTTRTDTENKSSKKFYKSSNADACLYNLTDSEHSLEAESSTYQNLGFSQCEFIIQTPGSHIILLNFTGIHSQSDMPVETGARHQHFQQAETETTAPTSDSVTTKTVLRKPLSHDKGDLNSTSLHSDVGKKPLSATVDSWDSSASNRARPHNSSHNLSVSHRDRKLDKHKAKPVNDKILAGELPHEHATSSEELVKNNISDLSKDVENPKERLKDSLTTEYSESGVNIQKQSRLPNCNLKLIIEEVNSSTESNPQVICWRESWENRIPLVFQYSVPVRITYVWSRHAQSGFSLDFKFLRQEEADCLFWCNKHLCLPAKQLCDGYADCPDFSDEQGSTCSLARQQRENGEPHVINVIATIISVIIGVVIVLALIFMISHIHCCNGACWGGDALLQPPHSQSSEVCRSPSGSLQESGQYEALLHQHPQRQTVSNCPCVDHQLCQTTGLEQPQQYHQHTNQTPFMNRENQLQSVNQKRQLLPPSQEHRFQHYMCQEHHLQSRKSQHQFQDPVSQEHCLQHHMDQEHHLQHHVGQDHRPQYMSQEHRLQHHISHERQSHLVIQENQLQHVNQVDQPYMTPEHQLHTLSSEAATAAPPDVPLVSRPHQQHKQFLPCHHHPEQQHQSRRRIQANKPASPHELYPPNIPLSADGEEGFIMAQKALHSKQQLERNWQVEHEVFRPPPNKTVYDRDSPPPPYTMKNVDSTFVPSVGVANTLRQARSSVTPRGSPDVSSQSRGLSCLH